MARDSFWTCSRWRPMWSTSCLGNGIQFLPKRDSTPFQTATILIQCYYLTSGTRFTPNNPDQNPPIRPHRTPVYVPTIPRYIDSCLSKHHLLRNLPDVPRFTGDDAMDIYYLIRYLFLENDTQRAKLLPTLAGQKREVMENILNKYKRTVKANIRIRMDSRGTLTTRWCRQHQLNTNTGKPE